jgi:hypothetical protein
MISCYTIIISIIPNCQKNGLIINCQLLPSSTSISVKSNYQFILDGYHDNSEYNSYVTFIAGYYLSN